VPDVRIHEEPAVNCPECKASAKCIDTRQRSDHRYRRYACARGHKFTTREIHESDFVALCQVASREDIARAVALALPEFVVAVASQLEASVKGGQE